MGHLFRSLAICRALHRHDVILVTGGPPLDVALPDHVRHVRLPSLAMDVDFAAIRTEGDARSLDDIREERRRKLYCLFEGETPEMLIVELYPFGRKAFRFELDPILQGLKAHRLKPCRVVCSLRDILVEKNDPEAYERRVLRVLNGYFHLLLVHADPKVIRLEDSFAGVHDIKVPVEYTGFIAPEPVTGNRETIRRRLGINPDGCVVVAAAGGGKVGMPLLEAVVRAVGQMKKDDPLIVYVFTGPFLDTDDFNRLSAYADSRVKIARFTADYVQYLAAADLSISMAGYNTCMDILAAGVPAWLWPFEQNREQRLRAEHLTRRGDVRILENKDLVPLRLAESLDAVLRRSPVSRSLKPSDAGMDIDGAARTAVILERLGENDAL